VLVEPACHKPPGPSLAPALRDGGRATSRGWPAVPHFAPPAELVTAPKITDAGHPQANDGLF